MPVYTPPNFNVFIDLWFGERKPAFDDADFENQACQFYLYSRGLLDIEPSNQELWVPPCYIRLPTIAIDNWQQTQIAEVPRGSGRYYRARFKEIMHMGFPNEYLIIITHQCDAEGEWILRDVLIDTPQNHHAASGTVGVTFGIAGSGDAGAGGHEASGGDVIEFQYSAGGTAERN